MKKVQVLVLSNNLRNSPLNKTNLKEKVLLNHKSKLEEKVVILKSKNKRNLKTTKKEAKLKNSHSNNRSFSLPRKILSSIT